MCLETSTLPWLLGIPAVTLIPGAGVVQVAVFVVHCVGHGAAVSVDVH